MPLMAITSTGVPSIDIVTSYAESSAIHRFRTLLPCHQLIHPIALAVSPISMSTTSSSHFGLVMVG
jgi:hypothetical protein